MKRRTFNDALGLTLLGAGAGCGGGKDAGSAPISPWLVGELLLVRDGGSFDLRPTLPAGVPPNGMFRVSRLGAALPDGFLLSPAGQLSATSGAVIAEDVVFEYSF